MSVSGATVWHARMLNASKRVIGVPLVSDHIPRSPTGRKEMRGPSGLWPLRSFSAQAPLSSWPPNKSSRLSSHLTSLRHPRSILPPPAKSPLDARRRRSVPLSTPQNVSESVGERPKKYRKFNHHRPPWRTPSPRSGCKPSGRQPFRRAPGDHFPVRIDVERSEIPQGMARAHRHLRRRPPFRELARDEGSPKVVEGDPLYSDTSADELPSGAKRAAWVVPEPPRL